MLTPKIPKRQYAVSSNLVVSLFDADDMRLAMLTDGMWGVRRLDSSIPVIHVINWDKVCLDPIYRQLFVNICTSAGTISSCSVQPLVNHRLRVKDDSKFGSSAVQLTSEK
jgi:hypothetical protein